MSRDCVRLQEMMARCRNFVREKDWLKAGWKAVQRSWFGFPARRRPTKSECVRPKSRRERPRPRESWLPMRILGCLPQLCSSAAPCETKTHYPREIRIRCTGPPARDAAPRARGARALGARARSPRFRVREACFHVAMTALCSAWCSTKR